MSDKPQRLTNLTRLPPENPKTDPQVRSLESRLEDGYARIDQARARGEDTTAWEDFWIGLLERYEAVMKDLNE